MIIIILFFLCLFSQPSFAVTPTTVPTKTPDDIQRIREAVQQKVLEKLHQITTSTDENKNKAFFGTIIQISPDTITIDYNHDIHQLKTSSETVYIDAKRNKAKIDSLKIGQEVLALGQLDQDGVLNTKRLVATDLKLVKLPSQIVFGQITDISQTSPIFTLIPFNNKEQQFQIKTTTATTITSRLRDKLKSENLTKGHRLIATIKASSSSTYTAIDLIDLDFSPSPSPTVASAKAGTPTQKAL